MTRALYRPGRETPPNGGGLPVGRGDAERERDEVIQFLAESIPPRSRFTSPEEHMVRVKEEARAMTLSERVHLEIELTQRFRTGYSFDYDPLKY